VVEVFISFGWDKGTISRRGRRGVYFVVVLEW